MSLVEGSVPPCSAERPTGRRFYIHAGSLSALVTAQPGWYDEVIDALTLSAASRAAATVVEDALILGNPTTGAMVEAAARLNDRAATGLAGVFQSLVYFDPPDTVEFLLAKNERITAWCYEGGYFTYATDETSAQIMYLESGSLRELRRRIRLDPSSEPCLTMISGPRLFVADQRFGAGRGKVAADYRAQHRRLVRTMRPVRTSIDAILDRLRRVLRDEFGQLDPAAAMLLQERCLRHATMTLRVLEVGQEGRWRSEWAPGWSERTSPEHVPAVAAT